VTGSGGPKRRRACTSTSRLRRGGSTITQQLAKNLYLSRDRTLARKAREALVAVALEGTVPKARLLEIYLNLIEWGPGLHGIGPAARRYFDEDARALTPRQACFLAAIIPSPIRSHAAVAAGRPASLWSARVDDLLGRLHATGVLDDSQLAEALAAPLAFGAVAPPVTGAPGAGAPTGEDGVPPEDDESRPAEDGAPPRPGDATRDGAASGG
jgi:membrane peptidoglycan carboxypeptidase